MTIQRNTQPQNLTFVRLREVQKNQSFDSLAAHYLQAVQAQCKALFTLDLQLQRPWFDRLLNSKEINAQIKDVHEYQHVIDYADRRITLNFLRNEQLKADCQFWQEYRANLLKHSPALKRITRLK